MKNLGISILIMMLLMAFSIWIDILQGFEKRTVIQNALSPYQVMDTSERGVLFLIVFIFIVKVILSIFKKKNGTTPN